ncbi:hypothetical protein L1987_59393 [Smallanthus sonchifolius]|uniref:Uncharacterized protein n=1 Tax=Smallanthus sonchifolius TaxID=185202 RepID=A0ACB9D557_9ASTR|nr:hypothetical protein L1987_59393 [Smallanthus sonchifolius]
MLDRWGLGGSGYKVTKNLHATCEVQLPGWIDRMPRWTSTNSGWIGYVAVCNDDKEIGRLGCRDVGIAYRGTATCLEWIKNLSATLTSLSNDVAPEKKSFGASLATLTAYDITSTFKHCPIVTVVSFGPFPITAREMRDPYPPNRERNGCDHKGP